jgi:predicted regulator of Ras-like GTPase activity (Roadblock/LC7/MglB family)
MDPAKALAELRQISTQVERAVIFDGDSRVLASTLDDDGAAAAMAEAASGLLAAAAQSPKPVVQLEAALPEGSVVLVTEGGLTIAATTSPEPTIGLVLYDLRRCLRSLEGEPEKPPAGKSGARASRQKKAESKESDAGA